MQQAIRNMSNNCTLVAVQEVSRKSDAEIFEIFRKHGYKDNKGMKQYAWINAARDLGLELETVATKPEGRSGKMTQHTRYSYVYGDDITIRRYSSPNFTLAEFLKVFKQGVYFVSVYGHALVVRDGKLVDPNWRYSLGMRRKVTNAYKVLNAPAIAQKLTQYLHFPRAGVKRCGTASWQRFHEAFCYTRSNQNVTKEMLFANTSYKPLDFAHDLNKGIIAYLPEGI